MGRKPHRSTCADAVCQYRAPLSGDNIVPVSAPVNLRFLQKSYSANPKLKIGVYMLTTVQPTSTETTMTMAGSRICVASLA